MKPQRKFIRLPDWDYRAAAIYFVTFCTHNRQNLFDDTRLHEMAAYAWAYIPQQPHAAHVVLDEWVVMPNHVHGLIVIQKDSQTLLPAKERPNNAPSGSLGAIIGNYKSLVTQRIHALLKGEKIQVWQRGYYERIVQNERELNATRKYIRDNPTRWAEDRDNLDHLLIKMRYVGD